MKDEKEVMEREPPDCLDERDMEGTKNSSFLLAAKRRRFLMESDSGFVDCKLDSIVAPTPSKDEGPSRYSFSQIWRH